MFVGSIVLPPIFIYLFDNYPFSMPILFLFSFYLVYLDFKLGKPWNEYSD